MALLCARVYLIVHICLGILIIGFELAYRWLMETYQIHIRICLNIFYIEFRKLNARQSFNWFGNTIHNLAEMFYVINDRCSSNELKFNLNPIFRYLRYLWLSIICLYYYRSLRRKVQVTNVKQAYLSVSC